MQKCKKKKMRNERMRNEKELFNERKNEDSSIAKQMLQNGEQLVGMEESALS